jgi:hypothetical protein
MISLVYIACSERLQSGGIAYFYCPKAMKGEKKKKGK